MEKVVKQTQFSARINGKLDQTCPYKKRGFHTKKYERIGSLQNLWLNGSSMANKLKQALGFVHIWPNHRFKMIFVVYKQK